VEQNRLAHGSRKAVIVVVVVILVVVVVVGFVAGIVAGRQEVSMVSILATVWYPYWPPVLAKVALARLIASAESSVRE
jgi:hypothetical protein